MQSGNVISLLQLGGGEEVDDVVVLFGEGVGDGMYRLLPTSPVPSILPLHLLTVKFPSPVGWRLGFPSAVRISTAAPGFRLSVPVHSSR